MADVGDVVEYTERSGRVVKATVAAVGRRGVVDLQFASGKLKPGVSMADAPECWRDPKAAAKKKG